jgi:hypothetical protein
MGSLASAGKLMITGKDPQLFSIASSIPDPLKWEMPLPDFFRQVPERGLAGRRRMSGALLVPMLLIGGCGYEDLRLRPPVAIQRWF